MNPYKVPYQAPDFPEDYRKIVKVTTAATKHTSIQRCVDAMQEAVRIPIILESSTIHLNFTDSGVTNLLEINPHKWWIRVSIKDISEDSEQDTPNSIRGMIELKRWNSKLNMTEAQKMLRLKNRIKNKHKDDD